MVALRKESVDRNTVINCTDCKQHASLSARRAWIEIKMRSQPITFVAVALRKESVDRNIRSISAPIAPSWSLSARRAWIEMQRQIEFERYSDGRSPQGERG